MVFTRDLTLRLREVALEQAEVGVAGSIGDISNSTWISSSSSSKISDWEQTHVTDAEQETRDQRTNAKLDRLACFSE